LSVADKPLSVQVVYAAENEQALIALQLQSGATIADAIQASGLRRRFDLGDLAGRTGIHGRLRPEHEPLRDGDRIEIYRPLLADPKDARRKRARVRRP
jgi:putative ubiquitin-RnfH superfamily antitoxin RatB of RatAB toxin-antitoxin module